MTWSKLVFWSDCILQTIVFWEVRPGTLSSIREYILGGSQDLHLQD